jgi:hypothetical protein
VVVWWWWWRRRCCCCFCRGAQNYFCNKQQWQELC